MKPLTTGQIAAAVNGRIADGNEGKTICGVSTDTRKIKSDELFFALLGENSDGHKYMDKAYENGCRAAVVSKMMDSFEGLDGMTFIVVEDTLKALQDLAKYYLTTFDNLLKIGITGSTGKTSTKELLFWSLCGKYETAKNFGNFNNHIGMPLTALSVEEKHQAAIFEMGMGNFGEIDCLAEIAKPEIGVITNIGVSHISELGSRENILKAKMEITGYFNENSILVVNYDNDLLSTVNWGDMNYKVVKVGSTDACDYIVKSVKDLAENGVDLTMQIDGKEYEFHIPIPGKHNGHNGAVAIATAIQAGVPIDMIADTIAKCEHTDKRLVIIDSPQGIKVIDDTYNASPDSMRAGIDVLMSLEGKRKIVILADMLGMGKDTELYHRQVGAYAGEKKVDLVLTAGNDAAYISDEAAKTLGSEKARHYRTRDELIAELDSYIKSGDTVLIKASRALGMEKVAEYILKGRD